MKTLSRILVVLFVFSLLAGIPMVSATETEDTIHTLVLNSESTEDGFAHSATLDGNSVSEYDYVWHADPATDHDQVKNSPAEYFTGNAPTETEAVYIAHDIVYYPLLEQSKFRQVNYDGETEWVYFYEAEGYEDYIFSTLPALRTGFPSQMMHSEEEAYENAVLHITKAGTYKVEGNWHGQIRIDLGEDAFDDPTQKVTLILNGVTVTCTVAPGVVFANVYECDNSWEERSQYNYKVDTTDAGANVVLADGTINTVSGENIFRILRTKFKDENSNDQYPAQKKQYKLDAAFYSYMSMNIDGETEGTGVLNIHSGFEGLDTELHLTINGGNVNIYSQDDGINVNEDNVSVLAVNGGTLHICAGLGAEGDGIDSNGYMVIRGGTVISAANGNGADCGLDSDRGSYVLGGTVVALGGTMDWAESDETIENAQVVMNMRFSETQKADEAIIITDVNGNVIFAYDPDKDEVLGSNGKTFSGAILSCEGLQIGESYNIYVGGNVTGNEVNGVYDPASVTGFDGATKQCYSGNSVGGFGGMSGGFGGGQFGDQGGRPSKGDWQGNMQPGGQMPENMQPGGQMPGNMPSGDWQTPPEGFDPSQFEGQFGSQFGGQFGGQQTGATCTNQQLFAMDKVVNAFSSVSDVRHDSATEENGTCALCRNGVSSEPEQSAPTENAPTSNSPSNKIPVEKEDAPAFDFLGYGIAFAAGVVVTALIFTIVLLIKKKKQA